MTGATVYCCADCQKPVELRYDECCHEVDHALRDASSQRYVAVAEVERMLGEVSRDFAGAHVNAGVVVGAVRKALRDA